MLLPQTEAFHTLHRRLQCLPLTSILSHSNKYAALRGAHVCHSFAVVRARRVRPRRALTSRSSTSISASCKRKCSRISARGDWRISTRSPPTSSPDAFRLRDTYLCFCVLSNKAFILYSRTNEQTKHNEHVARSDVRRCTFGLGFRRRHAVSVRITFFERGHYLRV